MTKRPLVFVIIALFGLVACSGQPTSSKERDPVKRFLEGSPKHGISLDDIHHGGPPVDGIPALVNPRTVPVSQAEDLRPSDPLMVVVINGRARGYPLHILDRHELVNDRIEGQPFLVTFCPLCGSGVVFDRRVRRNDGSRETFEFGVSGLLYQSDVLLYDRVTDTLWSQLRGEGVVGPLTGTKLKRLSHTRMTWDAFKTAYPNGAVLSFETGHGRNYGRRAYGDYRSSDRVMFPVNNRDNRLDNKADVLGVQDGNLTVAVPRSALERRGIISFEKDGREILFLYNDGGPRAYRGSDQHEFQYQEGQLIDQKGRTWSVTETALKSDDGATRPRVAHTESYWFAWATFHPDTELVNK